MLYAMGYAPQQGREDRRGPLRRTQHENENSGCREQKKTKKGKHVAPWPPESFAPSSSSGSCPPPPSPPNFSPLRPCLSSSLCEYSVARRGQKSPEDSPHQPHTKHKKGECDDVSHMVLIFCERGLKTTQVRVQVTEKLKQHVKSSRASTVRKNLIGVSVNAPIFNRHLYTK